MSPDKTLLFFGKKKVFFGTCYEVSSVFNEKKYNIFACMESYQSQGSFGT